MKVRKRTIGLVIYFVLLLMPIYWMLNMSLRTNADILSSFALYPKNITIANYIKIFTDSSWYSGYINAMIYVSINMVISLVVALPAAYAFSRYRFLGDKHMFFWLLTNRMAPSAVFMDGYSLPRFFITIFIPLIRGGVGVTAFFCFMFSWVELLIARTLTVTNAKPISAIMTRTISATGLDYGLLATAGVLTIVPGMLVIWFARNHMAKGFALGRV